jgi:hypothetical protein
MPGQSPRDQQRRSSPWRGRLGLVADVVLVIAALAIAINLASSSPHHSVSPSPAPTASAVPTPSEAPTATPSPSASPLATPFVAPTPSIIPGSAIDLSGIAWWDRLHIEFGVAPEQSPQQSPQPSPQPSPVVEPLGYEQLRIGTLDGRVTSVLELDPDPGHSYVSLPANGEVLVANDFGAASSIRAVDAATGSMSELFVTLDVIPAVTEVPGAGGFIYALAQRDTGADAGIWYQEREGAAPRQVDSAPPDFPSGATSIWQLAVSPDGRTLVAQFCLGETSCTTHVVDLAGGSVRETNAIGWQRGFLGRQLLARTIGDRRPVAMDLDTLDLVAADAFFPGGDGNGTGNGTFATDLPYGWRADWPRITGDSLGTGEAPLPVRLVNGFSGEELTTVPLTLTWPSSCKPLIPRELPSGGQAGTGVQTLEDGVRMIAFGQGSDLVTEAFGPVPAPAPPGGSSAITIRGIRGLLYYAPPSPVPPVEGQLVVGLPTIQFEQDGCWYRITLAPLTDARGYAARF